MEAELFHADGQTDAIKNINLAVTLRISSDESAENGELNNLKS
jgi:hypothetical protein